MSASTADMTGLLSSNGSSSNNSGNASANDISSGNTIDGIDFSPNTNTIGSDISSSGTSTLPSTSASDIAGSESGDLSSLTADTSASTPNLNLGSTGSSTDSFLNSFLSGLTGSGGSINLASLLGETAPYAAIGAAAQSSASAQEQQTANTVAPLTSTGNSLIAAAQQPLQEYQSGSVTPSEQAILDENAASQRSQVAQELGAQGIVDSSALNSADQQIANNELAQRQQYVEKNLTDALALDNAGIAPLTTAITDTINSDTSISNTLTQLWGSLASAWAKTVAGNGSGSGSGSSGTGSSSGLSSLLNTGVSTAVKGGVNGLTDAQNSALNNSITQDANNATNMTPDTSAVDNIDLGTDSAMTADTAANLSSSEAALGLGSDLDTATVTAPEVGDTLADTGSDLASFSAGSAAPATEAATGAADATGGLTDAALTAGAPDTAAISASLPSVNLGTDAAAAGSSALGTAAATGVIGGALAALGWGLYSGLDPSNTPDAVISNPTSTNTLNPDGTLPSGNSVLAQGDIGVGLGTEETQGSGEIYQINPNGSSSSNDIYNWIGQSDSAALEKDQQAVTADAGGYNAGVNGDPTLTFAPQAASDADPADQPSQQAPITFTPQQIASDTAGYNSAISNEDSIFNSTGGAAAWGMSESDFNTALDTLLGQVQPGTYYAGKS